METIKKLIGLIIIASILLAGCGSLEGTVAEKAEASFILEVESDDARQAPTQEIFLTDHTEFIGAASSFEQLEKGDRVKVTPFDTTPDIPYFLASRVVVE
ncbi:hypothetical protein BBI15_07725 [Planococcus plakortidis]|uniref:DUF3221 domain-containing protein n=1 Tax=Planococcus plakortidis TaxID=1038856 RepID=A0A1C7E8U3_9BACL|nr:hypothetical protein [Planococcus plakortidis]ANU20111.1 hypothetical protein BBI15_07725 [Planococcus plakortidis]